MMSLQRERRTPCGYIRHCVAIAYLFLLFCAYDEIETLEKSFGGNCGVQPLKYYPQEELYTSSKCRMERKVGMLLEACHCREAYMPSGAG